MSNLLEGTSFTSFSVSSFKLLGRIRNNLLISEFELKVERNQSTTLVLVLVLIRFEIGWMVWSISNWFGLVWFYDTQIKAALVAGNHLVFIAFHDNFQQVHKKNYSLP